MNKYQNSFSVTNPLIVGPIMSLLPFTPAALKPTSCGRRWSHPAGIRVVQRALILVTLFLLPLLASSRAMAQKKDQTPNLLDMSLEDLMAVDVDSVYGASGFKQKVTEAPASITIITSEEIQRYGYRTLADILRNVRGFYVSSDRNYSYLGVRGYGLPGDYNSRITLLVDGHRLNDNIFDAALIGTEFPIDVDLIDRVEVIRGPNSSLYIASAFLGVINVITKRGRDLQKVSAAGSAASYGAYQGRVSYGNEFKRKQIKKRKSKIQNEK